MATTKIWKVQKRIDKVISYATNEEKTKNNYSEYGMDKFDDIRQVMTYATNPNKTEQQFFTTGINCEVKEAVKQMQLVKTMYGKENGILAFHAYQSFNEGEVNPEIAHEIGVKLAEEMWGDRFQVVVSTHLNTKHIHNHFVINSVSFKDGKKYYSNLTNTALLRKTSDEICEEYGLKVLEEKTCKSGINFENFYKKSMRDSDYYKFAKEDIDYAIKNAWTIQEFNKILSSMGYYYYYRAGKLSIRKEPNKRNIRVERAFCDEYSMDSIKEKIFNKPLIGYEKVKFYAIIPVQRFIYNGRIRNKYKPKGIVALYYYYRFLLGAYQKKNIQHKLTPRMREAIKKMDKYSEEIRFMCKYKISTLEDIEKVKNERKNDLRLLDNERNRLYYKRGKLSDSKEKDDISKEIIKVTDKMKKVKKELLYCDDIIESSKEVKKNLKYIVEEKWKKQKEESKVKDKNKVR